MDERQVTCADVRASLRDYVIERRAEFEAHFAACPACREALEAERAALACLDALPAVEPPAKLAEATLRRVAEVARPEPRRLVSLATVFTLICVVGLAAAIFLPALARSREAARRSSTANNLKQLGLVFKMYAGESEGGKYPPMAPYEGIFVFDLRTLYPEFLSDPAMLLKPNSPDFDEQLDVLTAALEKDPPDWELAHRIVAQNYVYTGYPISEETGLARFQEARMRDNDLEIAGKAVYRLREGIERFYITDINNPAASTSAQSDIPVLVENPATREEGIYVLYMDGHVEFIPNGEKFPATEAFRNAFSQPPLKK